MLQNCGDKEEEKEHVGSSKGRTVARAAYFLSHAGVVHGVAAWYTLRLHKETKASISTAPGIKGRHWRQVLSSPALPPPQSPYVGKVQMAHAAVFLPCLCVFHYRKLPLPQGVWCFCVTPVLATAAAVAGLSWQAVFFMGEADRREVTLGDSLSLTAAYLRDRLVFRLD